jgi:rhamnosyltransferase
MAKVIDAVIVTYNPDISLLKRCINSVIKDLRYIYIIDNNSNKLELKTESKKIKFVELADNMGLAYAQNIGIKRSLEEKSDYILISDQDTSYPRDYVKNMLLEFDNFSDIDKVAAIAPLFMDPKQVKANEGFFVKSLFGVKKFYPKDGLHEVFQAIASGKVLNAKSLSEIGLMNEDLFIDWVDFEWCWRARKKGYKIIGNANVIITHQLGDAAVTIGHKVITLRNPLRHYYITRNCVYLALRCDNLGVAHRVNLFFKLFKYALGFPIFSKPHLKQLKYTLIGLWHGIIGKMGRLDDSN